MSRRADDGPTAARDSRTLRRFSAGRRMWRSIAIRPLDDDPAASREPPAAGCHCWSTEVCDPIHLECRPRNVQMQLGSTQHGHARQRPSGGRGGLQLPGGGRRRPVRPAPLRGPRGPGPSGQAHDDQRDPIARRTRHVDGDAHGHVPERQSVDHDQSCSSVRHGNQQSAAGSTGEADPGHCRGRPRQRWYFLRGTLFCPATPPPEGVTCISGDQGCSQLDPMSGMRLRPYIGSAPTRYSVTQPFPDRRHTRSDDNCAENDENACERDDPHRLVPGCRCRKHNGQNNGTDDEAVGVHVPREPAALHADQPTADPAIRRPGRLRCEGPLSRREVTV